MTEYSKLLGELDAIEHAFASPAEPMPAGLARCHQVHGNTIIDITSGPLEQYAPIQADGMTTGLAARVGVQTADCLPVLFASRCGSRVAAVHAGWRGLNLGILLRAVDAFERSGVKPLNLVTAIGPAIGACCFEANAEVLSAFETKWGHLWQGRPETPFHDSRPVSACPAREQAPIGPNNLWINLARIARFQLVSAGIPDCQIEHVGYCTYCGPGERASYRRATHRGTKAERQWSWIGRRSSAT